jgi:putative ABC transport system permease protein
MLSVTIGTFSIVVMMSLAQSGHRTLSRSIEQIGGMRLMLWVPQDEKAPTVRDRAVYDDGFTADDVASLAALPHVEDVSFEATYGRERVWSTGNDGHETDVVAALGKLFGIFGWDVASGRLLNDQDNTQKLRVALVTDGLVKAIFPDGRDPIGQTVFVGREPYVVVGVLEKRDPFGINFGFDWSDSVFVPLVTAEVRDGRPKDAKFVVALTEAPEFNESVEKLANKVLLSHHRGVEDFQSLNFASMLEQFYQFFQVLDLIVAVIAGISLFAGGIGVMNIMLVSVTERTREIGIRKAVGASTRNILSQFLVEATTLSLAGGLSGVSLGILTTFAADALILHFQERWVSSISVVGVGAALATTIGIGLLFGAVPAWRAARLDIVEALRR